ncbi:pilus assembly FimT family protein [Calidifontibacillus oryziterrae]|uniref:pilus assembly FimT family protein n=1 Tax=Calidifontibacillus oryziterrae TaxID=1191699 RepID=UPI0002D846E3|nr:prepilin-type N-terminal cleavage/methylation domain-containing protein [Calidifontibacillus oryziterrae]
MFKKAKGLLKNSKGFTLVELLAVIVILGIIAGIAVPSIGNIIENTRKDATIASAQQVIEAARLMVATEGVAVSDTKTPIWVFNDAVDHEPPTTYNLLDGGFLESIPVDGAGIEYESGQVQVYTDGGQVKYSIYLTRDPAGDYDIGTSASPIEEADLASYFDDKDADED